MPADHDTNHTGALQRCLDALAAGPATTGQVAAAMGTTVRRASANLQHLWNHGRVTRTRYERPGGPGTGAGPRNIWIWKVSDER